MKTLIIIGFFALSFVSPSAQALDNIIRPYQGIRSSGMGGVLLSTGLYDENFFGNPARTSANPIWRLSLVQVQLETDYNFVNQVRTIMNDSDKVSALSNSVGDVAHGRIQTAMPSVYIPHLGRMSYAFGILTSTQTDVVIHRFYGIEPSVIVDVGPALSVSETFMDEGRLAIGATAHVMARANTKTDYSLNDWLRGKNPSLNNIGQSGAQYDFDIGSTYRVNWMPLGFKVTPAVAINNILDGRFSNLKLKPGADSFSHPARSQPRTFGGGCSFTRDELWKFTNATFAVDVRDIGNNKNGSYFRLIHFGGEVNYGILAPRAGINQGYLSAGLGINMPIMTLDFATYGEEMTLNPGGIEDRRYAVQVGFHI